MPLDFARTRTLLQQFDFHRLFIEELGWSLPNSRNPVAFSVREIDFTRREIAQLAGVSIYEIESAHHAIPDAKPVRLFRRRLPNIATKTC